MVIVYSALVFLGVDDRRFIVEIGMTDLLHDRHLGDYFLLFGFPEGVDPEGVVALVGAIDAVEILDLFIVVVLSVESLFVFHLGVDPEVLSVGLPFHPLFELPPFFSVLLVLVQHRLLSLALVLFEFCHLVVVFHFLLHVPFDLVLDSQHIRQHLLLVNELSFILKVWLFQQHLLLFIVFYVFVRVIILLAREQLASLMASLFLIIAFVAS